MSLHNQFIPACTNMLRNLGAELARSIDWARENAMSEADLLGARLAPDMFPLSKQIHFSCHQASDSILRLKHQPITQSSESETLADLNTLLETTLATLNATSPADIDGAAEQVIRLDLPNGMVFEMTGEEYVRDWALAQFYFHRMTAYAIMRQLGVPLGKADYVAHMVRYAKTPV